MRPCNNLINTPPTLGSKGSEKTTEGRHPLGFLLSGSGAIRSGRQSPPGGPDSASRFPRRYTLIALLAVLAAGLLFLLPGGLLHAQNDDMIEYPENGTAVVATFSATDPDMDNITWSLESGGDFGDFTIDSETGELKFNTPPNYEEAADTDTDNTYEITVTATDDDADSPMTAMKTVMVKVTDVEERATIMLSTRQPVVGQELMATLGNADEVSDGVRWTWEKKDGATWVDATGTIGESTDFTYLQQRLHASAGRDKC